MPNICHNCGRDIRTMAFRGTDWCSEYCRQALLGKIKCYYEDMWNEELGVWVPICQVHGWSSNYPSYKGPNRPCSAIDRMYDEDED